MNATNKPRSDYTPEPGMPDGDLKDKAAAVPGLKPDQKSDESISILDELDVIEDEEPIDLNREQQS